VSRRLALLAAVPLATLAAAGSATAAPAPSPPQTAGPVPSTAQGITLAHEGFDIGYRSSAVVVLIGANDYGLIARSA
jgi:hypothetical protein